MGADDVELGRRIAAARTAAKISGAELGSTFGADKTVMSKIERGTRRVNSSELAAIASRVGVDVRELLGIEPRRKVIAVAARLRERGDGATPALRRAREILEFEGLMDEVGEPESRRIAPTSIDVDRRSDGPAAARAVRKQLNLGTDGIADLRVFVEENFGIDVAAEPLGDEAASGVLVEAEGTTLALVNSSEIVARQRFTLAHELGHHLLDDEVDVVVEHGETGPNEDRADQFAAELLMPEDGIKAVGDAVTSPTGFVNTMLTFGVSRQALLRRLTELHLIDDATSAALAATNIDTLFLDAGRLGELEELESQRGRRQVPSRLLRRGFEAFKQSKIGAGPLAGLLAATPDDVEALLDHHGITQHAVAVPVPAGSI